FFPCSPTHPHLHPFPTRRSSDLLDPHTVEVDGGEGRVRRASADKVVIATGTRPARPASVEFDERTVIDSDGIVHLEKVPRSMVRSEEHTSELQSRGHLVCRLLLE